MAFEYSQRSRAGSQGMREGQGKVCRSGLEGKWYLGVLAVLGRWLLAS